MPWKRNSVMDERMKFVVRLLDGEKMSDLCREYGISRKTGYKFWDRYHMDGRRLSPTGAAGRTYTYTPLNIGGGSGIRTHGTG